MKGLLICALVLVNFYVHGQKFKAVDHYKDGKPKYRGNYTSCEGKGFKVPLNNNASEHNKLFNIRVEFEFIN